ncbi:hypothetical protein OHA11_45630 [Streptomyces sp. NBC_00878]|nr:hypothetical protein [Streptomyces sp. NBC_00878]
MRLGYVNWLPADLTARTSAVAQLHIDAWIAPSHTQAARVADGSLDLAVCWVRSEDLKRHGLEARLIGADRLYAVATGDDTSDVAAQDTVVLLDDDTTSWSSWNAYAEQLAQDTGAHVARIFDGGITGPAFFDHVRRSSRPVIFTTPTVGRGLAMSLQRCPAPASCCALRPSPTRSPGSSPRSSSTHRPDLHGPTSSKPSRARFPEIRWRARPTPVNITAWASSWRPTGWCCGRSPSPTSTTCSRWTATPTSCGSSTVAGR